MALDPSPSASDEAPPTGEQPADGARTELLVLILGGERYALSVDQVAGVDERRPITPLPGTPPAVLGVFNRLGDVVPALDLALLVQDRPAPAEGGYLAVGQAGSGPVALLVDEVEAVVAVEPSTIEPPLPTLEPARARLMRGQVRVAEHWITVLDLEGIIAAVAGRAPGTHG